MYALDHVFSQTNLSQLKHFLNFLAFAYLKSYTTQKVIYFPFVYSLSYYNIRYVLHTRLIYLLIMFLICDTTLFCRSVQSNNIRKVKSYKRTKQRIKTKFIWMGLCDCNFGFCVDNESDIKKESKKTTKKKKTKYDKLISFLFLSLWFSFFPLFLMSSEL